MGNPFWKCFGTRRSSFRFANIIFMFALIGLLPHDCLPFAHGTARPDTYPLKRQVKRNMQRSKLLPPGIWGGDGVIFNVNAEGVKIAYACADGEIKGRLKLDGRGNFQADGFHKTLRGGPLRADDKDGGQPVRFNGKVSAKSMTLKVTLIENKEVIGDFELKKDFTPRLRRCL